MALPQHWKLDDNAVSTTIVATTGNNAALEGGDNTSAKTVAGPGGSITAGLQLNGTDDGIDISGASVSSSAGSAFSASLWFKLDSAASASQRLMGAAASASNNAIRVATDTTIVVRFNNVDVTFTVPSIGTTNWHHLLVTRTTGNVGRLFLDGVESSTGSQTLDQPFAPTRLGRSSASFFAGRLAQVKLSATDESANVASLYAEGVTVAAGVPQVVIVG